MKILHTVEFYHPNVGGAQEVVKQISERLAARGHDVTVATTKLANRKLFQVNGVHIEEFDVKGNAVNGFQGEAERYQTFLQQGNFDIMMNYAAQQWTADLAFPILEKLPYRKVLIPCGFSGLYLPSFAEYFKQLPMILSQYDHLVFHAQDYRDINFARQHGLTNFSVIPNGASQSEFEYVDTSFRHRHGISENHLVLLTVGSHTGIKGHKRTLSAYSGTRAKNTTLIVIGNVPGEKNWWFYFWYPLLSSFKIRFGQKSEGESLWARITMPFLRFFKRMLVDNPKLILQMLLGGDPGCVPDCKLRAWFINLIGLGKKRVLLLDPVREDVVAAYHSADLFVFASNVEYSPLVLFEAMASRTPFLTLACGNAAEIVDWSNGGGMLIPTFQKEDGLVDGKSTIIASMIDEILAQPEQRKMMGEAGYTAWREGFTWEKIALEYEALYSKFVR